ncbi:hypothetical protein DKX38_009386 [Salix brachista]|uniref:Uncharacterized protein n=1 Tax=Salix brachista TaxID=2182728 RepID=A0A5N5MAB5_9ROSI|nr:hypothetical protein DKX38_009386 [Salix brachista]
MGSSLLPSVTASSRIAVTALCTFWIFSELVAAKHAGITRHYKFDVYQAAKCDEVVPDKDHRYCQWSDPRASHHSKG